MFVFRLTVNPSLYRAASSNYAPNANIPTITVDTINQAGSEWALRIAAARASAALPNGGAKGETLNPQAKAAPSRAGVFSTVEGALKQQVKRAQAAAAKEPAEPLNPRAKSVSGEKAQRTSSGDKKPKKKASGDSKGKAPLTLPVKAEMMTDAQTPRFVQTLKTPRSAAASTTTTPFPPASPAFDAPAGASLLTSLQTITERLQDFPGDDKPSAGVLEKLPTCGAKKRARSRTVSADTTVPVVPSTTDDGARAGARDAAAAEAGAGERGDQAVPEPPRGLQLLRTSSRTSSDNLLHALLSGAKYTPGPSPQNSCLQEQGLSALMGSGR